VQLKVHLDVPIPQFVGLVGNLSGMVEGRGVVDQDVDLAELILDVLEDFADLVAIGHVHLDGERLATHLANRLGGGVRVHPPL